MVGFKGITLFLKISWLHVYKYILETLYQVALVVSEEEFGFFQLAYVTKYSYIFIFKKFNEN